MGSRPPDSTASRLCVNFPNCAHNQSKTSKHTPNLDLTWLHLFLLPLSLASPISFKGTYIFLPQNNFYKRAPSASGQLLHLALPLVFRLHVPRHGPFLVSMWLYEPFLSEMLLASKVFCLTFRISLSREIIGMLIGIV